MGEFEIFKYMPVQLGFAGIAFGFLIWITQKILNTGMSELKKNYENVSLDLKETKKELRQNELDFRNHIIANERQLMESINKFSDILAKNNDVWNNLNLTLQLLIKTNN